MFEKELANYRTYFMEIVPVGLWESFYAARYNRNQLYLINNALPLNIIQNKGIEVEKDFKINITDLNTNQENIKFKHFHNTGNGGVTFKIDVIIDKAESWGYGKQGQANFVYKGVKYPARARISVWLEYWYIHMTPLYIVSEAIDVPNGTYIISNNPTRKQDFKQHTVWTLEFTTFNPLNLYKWGASQSLSKHTGKTVSAATKNSRLANCELKLFVYSPNKRQGATTQATRWLQEKLYQLGFMDKLLTTGWYNDEVMEAVKKFQFKYQKYFNLQVTGLMDQKTLDAICSF